MIAIGHTSVGVIVGTAAYQLLPDTISLPWQVIITGTAGIASHYLMDLMPHGHYNMNLSQPSRKQILKLVADVVVPATLIAAYMLITHGLNSITWLVGAGIFGAQLPDVIMGLRRRQLLPNWSWLASEAEFHASTHWHNPKDQHHATNEGGRKLGVTDLWQAGIVVLALILLSNS